MEILDIGNIIVAIERKNIKNMYLKVRPPMGEVLICSPKTMNLETIKMFAIKKLGWIKKQQKIIQSQARETPRNYIERESHYLWGERYLLKIIEVNQPPRINLNHKTILLQIPPNTDPQKKEAIMSQWYREELKQAIPPLIQKWEPLMGVKVKKFFVQQMKTKWGSCNVTQGNIRLNTELAKKPRPCLEYVVVHEMTHLLEPNHSHRFISLMDCFIPQWREYQQILNNLPISSFGHLKNFIG